MQLTYAPSDTSLLSRAELSAAAVAAVAAAAAAVVAVVAVVLARSCSSCSPLSASCVVKVGAGAAAAASAVAAGAGAGAAAVLCRALLLLPSRVSVPTVVPTVEPTVGLHSCPTVKHVSAEYCCCDSVLHMLLTGGTTMSMHVQSGTDHSATVPAVVAPASRGRGGTKASAVTTAAAPSA
jgi:hypothetical protein